MLRRDLLIALLADRRNHAMLARVADARGLGQSFTGASTAPAASGATGFATSSASDSPFARIRGLRADWP